MSPLIIAQSNVKLSGKNNFYGRIVGNKLLLPYNLATSLNNLSIRTADELISYLYSFPSTIANILNWEVDSVIDARNKLVDKLDGYVPEGILHPTPPPIKGYGVTLE